MSMDLTKRVDAEVEKLRAEPEALLRYDVDGNGELDDEEWALVRRMIERELVTRARHDQSPSTVAEPFEVGAFEVIGVLGRGGQGTTYLATDADGTRVALKKLHLGQANDWKSVELFDREAEALRQLDHPAIPSFVDAFHIEDDTGVAFYLAQEFVFGEDLEQQLDRDGRWTEDEALAVVHEVADILEYLHDRKPPIVHRDLKPSNLIRRNDGRLVLVDFGAAQVARSTVGGSTVVGTSGYMPMEQYVGNATPASDLYALGATAVHLLSGTAPIDLRTERMRLRFEEVIDVSPGFLRTLQALLEPHVEDRVASVEALRSLLAGNWDPSTALDHSPAFEVELAEKKWVAIREDQPRWLQERTTDTGRVIMVATHKGDGGHYAFDKFAAKIHINADTTKIEVPVDGFAGGAIMIGGLVLVLIGFWVIKSVLLASTAANVVMIAGCIVVAFVWYLASAVPRRTVLIGDGRVQVFGAWSQPLFDAALGETRADSGRLLAHDGSVDVCAGFRGNQGTYLAGALTEELERVQREESG